MYRILVVEDEDDIQKILENYLIDQGYAYTCLCSMGAGR